LDHWVEPHQWLLRSLSCHDVQKEIWEKKKKKKKNQTNIKKGEILLGDRLELSLCPSFSSASSAWSFFITCGGGCRAGPARS
jgi:hypothetical protein